MAIAFAAPFLILLLASPSVFATDYTVGGSSGWTLGFDYGTWASGKTFKVGDTLLFNYDTSMHQLDSVDENAYKSCSSSNAIKNYQDGKTKITLSKAGSMYFLCPTPGHCSGGMKLQVSVVAASGSPTTPSGSPTTPSGSPSTPSTPSPTTPSGTPATTAPSPKSNGAVSVSSGMIHLMGSLFVSAIILCFMF